MTGSTPFDTGDLLKAGLDEVRRVIREEEPVRPSARLITMPGADLTTAARHRRCEPPKLIRSVTGDLDWIAMKALEKDRTRRYETANGLAVDVKRFLANEGISARPPSRLYKFKKLLVRHKIIFVSISIITVLLVVGLIVVSAALAKEHLARRDADTALKQTKAEQVKAETAATKSQQITQFLEEMLQGVGPSVALGQDTTMLRGILDRTAERVGKEMTNQPEVEAELRGLIGRLYVEIGNYDKAEQAEREALALNPVRALLDTLRLKPELSRVRTRTFGCSELREFLNRIPLSVEHASFNGQGLPGLGMNIARYNAGGCITAVATDGSTRATAVHVSARTSIKN